MWVCAQKGVCPVSHKKSVWPGSQMMLETKHSMKRAMDIKSYFLVKQISFLMNQTHFPGKHILLPGNVKKSILLKILLFIFKKKLLKHRVKTTLNPASFNISKNKLCVWVCVGSAISSPSDPGCKGAPGGLGISCRCSVAEHRHTDSTR